MHVFENDMFYRLMNNENVTDAITLRVPDFQYICFKWIGHMTPQIVVSIWKREFPDMQVQI